MQTVLRQHRIEVQLLSNSTRRNQMNSVTVIARALIVTAIHQVALTRQRMNSAISAAAPEITTNDLK